MQRFDNASCWTSGAVPVPGDDVIFNGTGIGGVNITNNTLPQNLNSFHVASTYTGTIYFNTLFAVGNWDGNNNGTQEWNVTGNISVDGGVMKIFGDYLSTSCCNLSPNGEGQIWRSLNGNISVGSSGVMNGTGLGFPALIGPGSANGGASHGGFGNTSPTIYGNASAPTSLGSGGKNQPGGSALKLEGKKIVILGTVEFSGLSTTSNSQHHGSGGSVWLQGTSVTGSGVLRADGGSGNFGTALAGAGGRIRLSFNETLTFTGTISVGSGKNAVPERLAKAGTLSFTNNTWPGNWTLTGDIGLLGGDSGEGPAINVLGNFNSSGFLLTAYGDCFQNSSSSLFCHNSTIDGSGVWLNVSGNVSIPSPTLIDGIGLGFPAGVGPGMGIDSGSYGGLGGCNGQNTYGNELVPLSLGSGGTLFSGGGSGIHIDTVNTILVDGNISMDGLNHSSGGPHGGSGGSIFLNSSILRGNGFLSARGGSGITLSGTNCGGGGGRVAVQTQQFLFNGTIDASGGKSFQDSRQGSGGTVYVNASSTITSAMNVTTTGLLGGIITLNDTSIILQGMYNATGNTTNGSIILSYTDCGSNSSLASFYPLFLTPGSNCAPYQPSVLLRSVNDTNATNADLNCSTTLSDPDRDVLNVTVVWFNNSVQALSVSYNNNYVSGSFFNATLHHHNLSLGDSWNCSMQVSDGVASSSWSNSSNLLILSPPPDFYVNSTQILVSDASPVEGTNVTFTVPINNIGEGDATNVFVAFYNATTGIRTQIQNTTIATLLSGTNATLLFNWTSFIGTHNISVEVDYAYSGNGEFAEDVEQNNIGFTSLTVDSYNIIAGNLSGFRHLGNPSYVLLSWDVLNINGSNILIADKESNIEFTSLIALGMNITNASHSDDFQELDDNLSLSQFSDNITSTWTSLGVVRKYMNLTIYDKQVWNVPVINSTNSSNFITGILWDSSDGGTQFNASQDVVFVSEVNKSMQGQYGVYDFEVKVPAALRNYRTPDVQYVLIYVEIV